MLRHRIVDGIKRGIRNGEIPAHQLCPLHLGSEIRRYADTLEPNDIYLVVDDAECEICKLAAAEGKVE